MPDTLGSPLAARDRGLVWHPYAPLDGPEPYAVDHASGVRLGLTAPDGELRVWWTPWHEKRVLPALRELLDLPVESVIVAHGEPVHDRAAFERALELPPLRLD